MFLKKQQTLKIMFIKNKYLVMYYLFLTLLFSCYTNEIPYEIRESVGATLIGYEYKGGTYSFEWKGKRIESYGSVYLGYSIGDRFIAHVDKNDSSNFVLQHWEPFFYESEERGAVNGKVLINSSIVGGVKFEYEVDGKVYKRYQVINKKLFPEFFNIKRGEIRPVEYLIENPQRAIIHLGLDKIE